MTDKEQRLRLYADKFKTDKLEHGYMRYYANELPIKCRSMLEIGVAKGASAQLWDAFYGKDELDLYLMDLYQDPNHVSPRWVRNNGWVPVIGDQEESETVCLGLPFFEVIIDDGSHNAHHQLLSFKHFFWESLKEGGLYVIEDLHCNKDRFYDGGLVKGFSDTPLAMFKQFLNYGELFNPYFSESDAKVFKSLIGSVRIYDEKIAFITRK